MNLNTILGLTVNPYPEGYWSPIEDIPVGLVLIGAVMGSTTVLSADGTSVKAEGELVYYAYTQTAALRLLEILSFDPLMNWTEVLGNMPTPAEITVPKAGVLLKGAVPVRGYSLGPVELAFLSDADSQELALRMNAVENKLIAEGKIPHRYNPGIIYHAG